MAKYRLTASSRNNTKPLFTAHANHDHEVKKHLDSIRDHVRKNKQSLNVTVHNTETGEVHTHSIHEDAPTNSMGASCSTSGPIQTFDPMLMKNKKKKLLPFSVFRRAKGKQNVGTELGN